MGASVQAIVRLLAQLPLPSSADEVRPFLQQLYDVFSDYKESAKTIESKGVGLATASGEYYGIYGLCVRALKQEGKFDYGPGRDYVAATISPRIYGHADWEAREVIDGQVEELPFYAWRGNDVTTGKPYDVTVRPWYRHAVERGAGFTEPYGDPATGAGMGAYVAPLRGAGGEILGVVIRSFRYPRGST